MDEKEDNDDPLTQAFELNKKVEERAKNEQELKKEYLKLSEQCKTFATDLYNGCRSMKEITALLNIDEKEFNLSCGKKVKKESRASVVEKLRTAIDSDHKEVGMQWGHVCVMNRDWDGEGRGEEGEGAIHSQPSLEKMFLVSPVFGNSLETTLSAPPNSWTERTRLETMF